MPRRSGGPPQKHERPALAGTGALENTSNSSNAPRDSRQTLARQGSAALAARYDLHTADFQHAELAAARYLVRRYFLRLAAAKVIADELRLALLAGAAR